MSGWYGEHRATMTLVGELTKRLTALETNVGSLLTRVAMHDEHAIKSDDRIATLEAFQLDAVKQLEARHLDHARLNDLMRRVEGNDSSWLKQAGRLATLELAQEQTDSDIALLEGRIDEFDPPLKLAPTPAPEPRPIRVGDKVYATGYSSPSFVIAIDSGKAWLRQGGTTDWFCRVDALTRAP